MADFINTCPICNGKKGFSKHTLAINNENYTIIQCDQCGGIVYSIEDSFLNKVNRSAELINKLENQGR